MEFESLGKVLVAEIEQVEKQNASVKRLFLTGIPSAEYLGELSHGCVGRELLPVVGMSCDGLKMFHCLLVDIGDRSGASGIDQHCGSYDFPAFAELQHCVEAKIQSVFRKISSVNFHYFAGRGLPLVGA